MVLIVRGFQSPSRRFFFCNSPYRGAAGGHCGLFQSPSRRFFFCNGGAICSPQYFFLVSISFAEIFLLQLGKIRSTPRFLCLVSISFAEIFLLQHKTKKTKAAKADKAAFQSPSRRFFFCNLTKWRSSTAVSTGKFQSPSRRFFFCNVESVGDIPAVISEEVSISFAEIFLLQLVHPRGWTMPECLLFQSPSRRFFFCNMVKSRYRKAGAPNCFNLLRGDFSFATKEESMVEVSPIFLKFQSPSRRFFFCNSGKVR